MKNTATASFEIESWDEQAYEEIEGDRKLTRVSTTKRYSGEIEGRGSLEYLMSYAPDGSASFVGMERVVGRIGERSGSFVLQHSGTFEGGVAKASWFVVPGSATGELDGLRGEGDFESAHAESYGMALAYELD